MKTIKNCEMQEHYLVGADLQISRISAMLMGFV
jgi:hypothetical protein